MLQSMDSAALFEKLIEAYNATKGFDGFSLESLDFFDNYPAQFAESPDWWSTQKGAYERSLKPEFFDLIRSVSDVVQQFDNGLEKDVSKCIGQTHDASTRPIPYRWAALHTEGADKRIDVQFFINLTSIGLRVGIYSGQHDVDKNAWNARQTRIHAKKNEIFDEYAQLKKLGFEMLHTTKHDFASGSSGTKYEPSDSEELYQNVASLRQISFIRTLDSRDLSADELMREILKAFADTRKMYQMLQSSKYNAYKRDLV